MRTSYVHNRVSTPYCTPSSSPPRAFVIALELLVARLYTAFKNEYPVSAIIRRALRILLVSTSSNLSCVAKCKQDSDTQGNHHWRVFEA